ncbi:F0F1 ATP synthase subunit delta [Chloroflexota bacterium]
MASRVYARRYAQAVFEIARETGELDGWQSDLSKIASLSKDTEFAAVMESPRVHFEDKARLLRVQLGDVGLLALNLVSLLVVKGRLSIAGDIADGYQRLLDSHRGIEQVEVTTAVPLDADGKTKLAERLGAAIGKKVVLKPEVDASVVGGVIARVGDKLIDGSTRSKLLALKREMEK